MDVLDLWYLSFLLLTPLSRWAVTLSGATPLALQCPPCYQIHCSPKRAKNLRCRGGITTGICGCCPVCAKLEGDRCGGDWDYLGKCDRGLYCKFPPNQIASGMTGKLEGSCQKPKDGDTLSDAAWPAYCKPRCTPEFCSSNPRAVCSAVDNADKPQDCQTDCQHTSCQACRFVVPELECVKCAKDDFSCIKSFGKCAKLLECTRQKYPCKNVNIYESPGEFKCLVPECLDP